MVHSEAQAYSPKKLEFGHYCGMTLAFGRKEGIFLYMMVW